MKSLDAEFKYNIRDIWNKTKPHVVWIENVLLFQPYNEFKMGDTRRGPVPSQKL